jgi:V/A-type H+-transporting ATPase subunit A
VKGTIIQVAGPVIEADGMATAKMHEMVEVGKQRLIGEIIRLEGEIATIQVYENTSGIKPEEDVLGTGAPLSAELGPGLIGNIYDGIQRPLELIQEKTGPFIERGTKTSPLPKTKQWLFDPTARTGKKVIGGDILGIVKESELLEHKILVPPDVRGKLIELAVKDEYTIDDTIAKVDSNGKQIELKMYQKWPVRKPRPYNKRLLPKVPLITGQRIVDTFFPIAKGGTATIPGGFGTGKTVMVVANEETRWWMFSLVFHN